MVNVFFQNQQTNQTRWLTIYNSIASLLFAAGVTLETGRCENGEEIPAVPFLEEKADFL